MQPENDDIIDPLDSFEQHWKNVINEIKTLHLTPKMSMMMFKEWKLSIQNYTDLLSNKSRFTKEQQFLKIEQLENLLTLALFQSTIKYWDNERIKLKECYGPLGDLIYYLKKLFF